MVDSILQDNWFLGCCVLSSLGFLFSNFRETHFLLLFGLWLVLVHQFEKLNSCLLFKGLCELIDAWGDLEAFAQDAFLTLKPDVLGPADKAG